MNQRKILKSFHHHLKDLMLMYGFVKIADTYVKLSGDRDSAIILNIHLIRSDWSSFMIQPRLVYRYLYREYTGPIDIHLSDGNIRANINDFLPTYLKGTCQDTSDDLGNLYFEFQGFGSLSLTRSGSVSINIIHESFIDFYMKIIEQILRCELLKGLQVENFVSIVEFIDDMRRRRPFKSYDTFSDNLQLNFPWGYLVLHAQTESYINAEELKHLSKIEKIQEELNLHLITVNETQSMISLIDSYGESGRKQRKSLENQLESAQNNVSIYRSKLDDLLNKRDEWRKKVNHPETEKEKIYLGYQKYLFEVLLLMENKKSKPKKTKVLPQRIPVIDNLERIVIRRGTENWKQIQTYMDEFFKTKGYHRTSDREMWERTWCIVETQSFWIIMELDESGITNEHLNDYDQLSKHLTKVLVTSGFFLYSFEFSESLARLYDQGECVDHWVIDEGFEVDEQEISQPLAWESSKIANPYRMKDPEEVHLIDILYDWMEMLDINPQWMVEEVDSTQNFKKCHIFGYAIAQHSSV